MTASAPEKAAPIPAEVQPTDAMIEAAAKAIHDHWQNGPGPHARTWEKCCRDFPGAADDFRAKARVGLVAAILQDRADRQEERIREDERAPETVNALEGLFWLELREPGLVPQRKGPWPHARTKEILREFMKVNPTAYISVVTMSHDGPWFADAPETLGIVDGRCWPTARKHIASSSAAHAGQRGDAS